MEKIAPMSSVKLALLARSMRQNIEGFELVHAEPIAIVGMACRFPGGANNLRAFWTLLKNGVDAVSEAPHDRWNADQYYSPDPDAPGKAYARYGAFLDRIDGFDPEFFGISPREALNMDPQQRLLLEVCWETVEDAAIAPVSLAGSATGVFAGACAQDFGLFQYADITRIEAWSSSGVAHSMLANRVSYFLDLRGPSMALDTACSSSLTAVHLACQSLRQRECSAALAGGVNLMLAPEGMIALSKARMMAPDGRCKTFDSAADGYVRGEGCGVVLLKRLSDALADGDPIRAVIRGSAINQDGRSNGITAPNLEAQKAVLRDAVANAHIDPRSMSFIEAHGTGTSLGDPIEIEALQSVYDAPDSEPCLVGSVKTNIGHLEGAAGIAGLIKAVLALQERTIPRHLHLRELNPSISLAGSRFRIATEASEWTRDGRSRLAGVSSFGFGGTNAHVILEEAPVLPAGKPAARPQLLTLSARTDAALRELASRFAEHLGSEPDASLSDVCFTSQTGRDSYSHRLAVVASDAAEAVQALATAPRFELPVRRRPAIAFLFTGQGAQYAGMGAELYQTQSAFRSALDRSAEWLRPQLDVPLTDLLFRSGSPLHETAYTQPALFALEWALAQFWLSLGVRPDYVLGHSLGEYVAACVAGAFSPEDALRVVTARGRLIGALPRGKAAIVHADPSRVAALGSKVAVAAWNAPDRTVISGSAAEVDEAEDVLRGAGVETRELNVSHAFHSPLMDPILDEFEATAGEITHRPLTTPLVSNVSGAVLPKGAVLDARYWRRQLRETVQFESAMRTLARECKVFLEIGPHPTLTTLGRHCLPDENAVWLHSLRNGRSDWLTVLESLASMFTAGVTPDWRGLYAGESPCRVSLPAYPFQRDRFRLSRVQAKTTASGSLLGARVKTALGDVIFEQSLTADAPLLNEHVLYGTVIVPGAWHVSAFLEAAQDVLGTVPCTISNVMMREALAILPEAAVTVQTIVTPAASSSGENGAAKVQLFSQNGNSWRLHAAADLGLARPATARVELPPLPPELVSSDAFYATMNARGVDCGPGFRWVEEVWRRDGEALGRMRLPVAGDRATDYRLHPGLIDSCFQVFGATWPAERCEAGAYVPVGIEAVQFYRPPAGPVWCHARLRPGAGTAFTGDLMLVEETGEIVAEFSGIAVMHAGALNTTRSWLRGVQWQECERPATPAFKGEDWLLFAGEDEVAGLMPRDLRVTTGVTLRTALEQIQMLIGRSARLWLITRGAHRVSDNDPTPVDPFQAPLCGLGLAIAREHPEMWGGLIDLGSGDAAMTAAVLLDEIRRGGDENAIALRGGRRYVRRLVRDSGTPKQTPAISASGVYLITGGLGALGRKVARWLIDQGARRLVLVSRHAEAVSDLEQLGAEVMVAACDVSSEQQLAALLADPRTQPLRGVVHAAGVLDDGVVTEQTWARFEKVLAPKIEGAWNLHRLTQQDALDFFVLFSSAASLLGSAGQSNYAAANAFLDSLAEMRRAAGLPGLSINWGPWAGEGMAARTARHGLSGLPFLPPDEGVRIFGELLGEAAAQMAVFQMPAETRRSAAADPGFVQQLTEAAADRRQELLQARIRTHAAAVLGLDEPKKIDPRRPLREYGLDSVMSLDLARAIGELVRKSLPATLLYDYPTIEGLAGHLLLELGLDARSDSLVDEVRQLSEQEMAAFITETLHDLREDR